MVIDSAAVVGAETAAAEATTASSAADGSGSDPWFEFTYDEGGRGVGFFCFWVETSERGIKIPNGRSEE